MNFVAFVSYWNLFIWDFNLLPLLFLWEKFKFDPVCFYQFDL